MPAFVSRLKQRLLRQDFSAIELVVLGGMLVAAAFWLSWQFVRPAPPSHIVMSTGPAGGAYQYFAERYRDALAREGITLELRPSTGAVENLQRLKTDPEVDLAFVQGGIIDEPDSEDLASLGTQYLEPVWVFYRGTPGLERLVQLKGKRIAVGRPGSGTLLFSLQILSASGFQPNDPHLVHLGGDEAVDALRRGRVDALLAVGAPQAPLIARLLAEPGLQLLDFAQAEGYARRFPHLETLRLPRATLDLAQDRPPRDQHLLAATANLVARADLHPAVVALLLKHSQEIHGKPGLLQGANQFPAPRDHGLPLHGAAKRFYENGAPLLQRYLPFWLATLIDRMLVLLLPLIGVALPLFRILPGLYRWRMDSRVYRWYGELKLLEHHLEEEALPLAPALGAELLERLSRIETEASRRKLPLAFSKDMYTLREHIQLVRHRITSALEPNPSK
ncbi:MAG: TAXI family TRAP transporter solute-binding subunit [Zoogloea sp.]|uniref:TAXI family TRAP transporter solute-binding subunit n=1 Tax=Zoogloea sp. TaxID=49181 RepID=UPI003F30479E